MKILLPAAMALLLPLVSLAADDYKPLNVKPGLWETKVTSDNAGLPTIPDSVLANIPPEQRARIEENMKARQSQGPHTTTSKTCISQDRLDKPLTFGQEKPGGACKYELTRSSASEQEIKIDCSSDRVKSHGTIHVQALDSENIKGESEIVASSDGTHNMTMKVSFTAHRLGSDCGDIKPK